MILDRKRWGTQAVIAIALSIALLFLGLGGLVSAQSRPIRIYTNGNLANYDVPPTMVQGRVLVPLRGVFEQLGATVDYNAQTQRLRGASRRADGGADDRVPSSEGGWYSQASRCPGLHDHRAHDGPPAVRQ